MIIQDENKYQTPGAESNIHRNEKNANDDNYPALTDSLAVKEEKKVMIESDGESGYDGMSENYRQSEYEDPEEKLKEIEFEDQFKNFGTADEIFYAFLRYAASKTNHDYFVFTFKFVVLFRESMNITMKQNEEASALKGSQEYTAVFDAEKAPEMCNSFVTEFMETAGYFGNDTSRDKITLIEMIQYFCYWLFYMKYTTMKLTLISN